MRAWNEAVEDADMFRKMMDKMAAEAQMAPNDINYHSGENRKARRARLREEARLAKRAKKVSA